MGRRHFLARLALGRSAFQELENDQPSEDVSSIPQTAEGTRQSYDPRGRPINHRTNLRNAEMRRAQNSILALVGVVEERQKRVVKAELDDLDAKASFQRQTEVLRREHERGEDVDDALTAVQHILHWVPLMISARYQAGLYPSRRPLLNQIYRTFRTRLDSGIKGLVSTLMPGAAAYFVHTLTGVLLTNVVEAVINLLQKSLIAKGRGRKHTASLYSLVDSLWSTALLGIDLALLPLEFFAVTQMLGLRSAFPLLPSWQVLLPFTSSSIHSYMWESPIATPILRSFCSPAALLLILRMVYEDSDPSAGIPICSLLTNFRYPDMGDTNAQLQIRSTNHHLSAPRFTKDPLGWILYRGWIFRCRVLKACNWTVTPRDDLRSRDDELVRTERRSHEGVSVRRYRSTHLSLLPMKRLATSIDVMFQALLVLPLHSFAYRSVAMTYLNATSPGLGSSVLYPVAGGGNFGSVGSYLNKIGLGLAMHSIVDISVVTLAYLTARRYGTRRYGWKMRDTVQQDLHEQERANS